METPAPLRCELTEARLALAGAELAAALRANALALQEARRPWRERSEPWLRGAGLLLCAAGALLSGWAVVVTPGASCRPGEARPDAFYQLATPLFAALAVPFWFLPRLTAALRAWAPGAAAGQAPALVARVRRLLPCEVTYRLEPGRIASARTPAGRWRETRLAAVRLAVVGPSVACLFGRGPLARLLRVVWLAGPAERAAVLAALAGAGVPVIELPEPPPPAAPPASPAPPAAP